MLAVRRPLFTGCPGVEMGHGFGRAEVAIVDPEQFDCRLAVRRDGESAGAGYVARDLGESSPAVGAGLSAVAQLAIDHKRDDPRAAVDDRDYVVPPAGLE